MNTIYNAGFYAAQSPGSNSSAEKIVPIVKGLVQPESVVDVGCGTGAWLACFQANGVEKILGIDGEWVELKQLQIPQQHFVSMNLSEPTMSTCRFDLAISLEVAEHLPTTSAFNFVRFLCSLAPVVMFSAAIPGQGGASHVNEQWPEYWIDIFASMGYQAIDCIRPRIWNTSDVQPWYAQNTFLYVDETCFKNYNALLGDSPHFCLQAPMRVVHPGLFAAAAQRPSTGPEMIKEGVRRLVSRMQRFVKVRPSK